MRITVSSLVLFMTHLRFSLPACLTVFMRETVKYPGEEGNTMTTGVMPQLCPTPTTAHAQKVSLHPAFQTDTLLPMLAIYP